MLSHLHSRCVDACRECIAACESCLGFLGAPSLADRATHCAEVCHSSIRLCRLVIEELELRSVFSIQVCALCAVICRACAEECEAWAGPAWRECAAACLRAAAECHAVATLPRASVTALRMTKTFAGGQAVV